MLRSRLVACALAALLAAPSFAAPAKKGAAPAAKLPCFSPVEFEAEQAIRLHTELMVIGLTCTSLDSKEGPSLFAQYKMFTLKHQAAIQSYEKAVQVALKRNGAANPVKEFDSFRTRLANEASQRVIALTSPIFCASHAGLVAEAMAMKAEDLTRVISVNSPGVRMAALSRCDMPVVGAAAEPAAPVSPAGRPPAKPPAKAATQPVKPAAKPAG